MSCPMICVIVRFQLESCHSGNATLWEVVLCAGMLPSAELCDGKLSAQKFCSRKCLVAKCLVESCPLES